MRKKLQLISYNMMIGYDIYDCFTMEHFRLRQRMTLTIKIYCSRLYKRATEIETKGTYVLSPVLDLLLYLPFIYLY
jgi:hypothetical protein